MKRLFLLTASLLLLSWALHAKGLGIKMGGDYAYFKNKKIDTELAYIIGTAYEWRFIRKTVIAEEVPSGNKLRNTYDGIFGNGGLDESANFITDNDSQTSIKDQSSAKDTTIERVEENTRPGDLFIKIGGNYSYLKQPSYGKPGVSYLFGIGKDWRLYRWIHLRTEVLISNSTTALKNRTVQSGSDLPEVIRSFPHLPNEGTGFTDIDYFDFDIQLRYLEIPLLLKVEKTLRKNLSIGLELGYSLKISLKDASKTTFLRTVKSTDLTEEERKNFRFDFRTTSIGENYSYHGRGLCPSFGMSVHYSKFQIGLRYQVDYVDWVASIVIGDDVPFRIWNLSMGYRF